MAVTTAAIRVHDRIAEVLVDAGIECIFGYMGEDNGPVVVSAEDRGIAYYASRHENQAVAMADGYARATHRVGVATVTSGPGFTNGLTAIYTASRAHSGVVILAGGGRPGGDDHHPGVIREASFGSWLKFFPKREVCEAAGIGILTPADAGESIVATQSAIERARRGETVVVMLGRDVLREHAEGVGLPPSPMHTEPKAPDAETIVTLADLLQETWAVPYPLILAGRGAVASGAAPALRRLGELTGALLATSLPANGLFNGDPYNAGVCGSFSTPVASGLIPRADCVLAFGVAMNGITTDANKLFPKALVVQVDTDSNAIGRFVDVELGVEADVRLTAEALVAELERRGHSATGFRTSETAAELAGYQPGADFIDQSTPDRIDPRTLMRELDCILPENRIFCCDGGYHIHFSISNLRVQRPENFVFALEAGSIGLGIGTGIGAAIGRPGEPVFVFVGDGGLMMSLGEIETAVRYRLPLVLVVSNDSSLKQEAHFLSDLGLPPDRADIPAPSFTAIAEAFGAGGMTVRSVADLPAVAEAISGTRELPLLIDCYVNSDVRV